MMLIVCHYSRLAHPLVGVMVIAPIPLSGRSPRRLTELAFALDSPAKAGPSLGSPAAVGVESTGVVTHRPQAYYTGHSVFSPGGSVGWENYSLKSAHQYVDITLLVISAFNSLSP